MQSWQARAARNNAELCDLVCRANGGATVIDAAAWTSPTRSPSLYPDAVTLSPDVGVDDLLARVDDAAGCSIKDSFASLDLSSRGFRVMFEAQWLVRPAVPDAVVGDVAWDVVRGAGDLARWVRAWQRDETARPPFVTALLDQRTIVFGFERQGDRVMAGAVFNHGDAVVGISNFFAPDEAASASWASCVATVARSWPGLSIVTYASGVELELARSHGFQPAGPLRVWLRDR